MQHGVAIITPGSFPIPSAKSSSVERVVEQVMPLVHAKQAVVIFGRRTKRMSANGSVNGVPCYRVPYRQGKRYMQQVVRKLRIMSPPPSLIQIENRPQYVLTAKKNFPRIPVWLSLHSTTYINKPFITPAILRQCLQRCDLILVNSEFLKSYMAQRYPAVSSKIVVNHLGVDAARFQSRWESAGAKLREAWLASQGLLNKKVILFAGRWKEQKGVHHLLEAMPTILSAEPDAVLVLVGGAYYGSNRKTPYVRRLELFAKRFGKQVRFMPFAPYDEMAAWYASADVVAVPSVRDEAFGLVLVEAMATGIPVIASNIGGMREIVEHGVTGYLADVKSLSAQLAVYISELLRDPLLHERIGRNGRERVLQHFTWQATAERWLAIWQRYG